MDIVARLKEFINYLAIPVTQFADTCRIPRPSLSQLLNGRNKKVSDELIGKIHEAYPQLSVMWLMFGEGTMLFTANMKTSEPQTTPSLDFSYAQSQDSESVSATIDFNSEYSAPESENLTPQNVNTLSPTSAAQEVKGMSGNEIDLQPDDEAAASQRRKATSPTISFNPAGGKSIVNIIVYYSDNSFESFVPSSAGH